MLSNYFVHTKHSRIGKILKLISIDDVLYALLSVAQQPNDPKIVSQVCLGCICEVTSGCNTTIGCTGTVCGPFAITWGYWADAGKQTLNGEELNDECELLVIWCCGTVVTFEINITL